MTFSSFLKFIRIETNLASALPATLGFLFSFWHFGKFDPLLSALFFLALMCVSAFVTAWNALMDYHKAIDQEYKSKHNQLILYNISLREARIVCATLMGISLLLGMLLIFLTNWLLLLLGGICLLVTVFYTFSPFAFSRMPLGEILAGAVEGLGAFFLATWVNSWREGYLTLHWDIIKGNFSFNGNLWTLLLILLAGLATAVFNFNIMLADNLCDLEQDVKNERYTLPYYIGKPASLKLLHGMYWFGYGFIFLGIATKMLPWTSFLVFLSIPFLKKNAQLFNERQIKSETFPLIIQNLPIFEGAWIVGMILGILFLK